MSALKLDEIKNKEVKMSLSDILARLDLARQLNQESREQTRRLGEDLKQILKTYEVYKDQEKKEVEIKVDIFPGIGTTRVVELTDREIQMLEELKNTHGEGKVAAVLLASEIAQTGSEKVFPAPEEDSMLHDGHQDAFRHAYWNALLTNAVDAKWAEEFATAHEQAKGSPNTRTAMDLYNNELGRRIATENPDANAVELAELIKQAVKDGEAIVIHPDDQNIAWSDDVDLWNHGEAENRLLVDGFENN